MTASIDGQAFASDSQAATARAAARGTYVLMGAKVTSTTNSITLGLYNIAEAGTYPLGVTSTVFGGTGNVFQAGGASVGSWDTLFSGASGKVTVSTLTASRIAGTFFFTAAGSTDPTSIRTVTNGSFDLPVTGSAGTLPANAGSSMTARINAAEWTAATVIVQYSLGVLRFSGGTSAGNPTYNLTFLVGSMTGPGNYPLNSTTRKLTVTSGTTQVWDSQFGGTAAVVVTELTTSRVKGSFTATLPPASGTGPTLTIVDGLFNLGLP